MEETISTKQRLADAIREAKPDAVELIEAALRGEFDDFESFSPTPQLDLIQALTEAGLNELATRAREGDFDGTQAEAEAWFAAEGKALMNEFVVVGGEA